MSPSTVLRHGCRRGDVERRDDCDRARAALAKWPSPPGGYWCAGPGLAVSGAAVADDRHAGRDQGGHIPVDGPHGHLELGSQLRGGHALPVLQQEQQVDQTARTHSRSMGNHADKRCQGAALSVGGVTDEHLTLAQRYTGLWNLPDDEARMAAILDLWTPDGTQITDANTYRRHADLLNRVRDAYDQFVGTGQFRFELGGDLANHAGVVTFTIRMVPVAGGPPAWQERIILHLDSRGLITVDHQMELPNTTASVVSEFFERLATAEPDDIASLFANSVDWEVNWPRRDHTYVPWIKSRSSRSDVAEHFAQIRDHNEPAGEPGSLEVLVDGSEAVAFVRLRNRAVTTGRTYDAMCAVRFTVLDDRIVRYHVYEDSLAVAEAFDPGRG